jgi:RNA polymerase sigma-70 factor, ECF subfamily
MLCSTLEHMAARRFNPGEKRHLFEQVALPHLDALYTAALRLSHSSDDAKDLLQDTILRAYRFFDQFEPGTNCRAWLLTILYNNFRNNYRRRTREQLAASIEQFERQAETHSLTEDNSSRDPEELLAGRSAMRQFVAIIETLPPEFREALLLVDVQELNYQEIAGVLGVPLGTVKSRVSRGRALIRQAMLKLSISRSKTGS